MATDTNTFASRYCAREGIEPTRYAAHIRKAVLYPHARVLVPIIKILNDDFDAADNDFIQLVGRISSYHEFFEMVTDYVQHPRNIGFLRRTLKVRVSTERMRKIVKGVFRSSDPRDDQGSASPLG